jgi:hypothetical protein
MPSENHFAIQNESNNMLVLNIEPEAVMFSVANSQAVSVHESYEIQPLTVLPERSEAGEPFILIWQGDGNVRVEKDGRDVFDLV